MTSGWECVDFGVFMGLVSLLHNYEWSIFGAVLLGLGEALPNFRLVCRKCPRTVGQWGKGMGRAEKEIVLVLATRECA